MSNSTPCALCGSTTNNRIMGRAGCACVACIGEAAKQAIAKENVPARVSVTASDSCLLCGDAIVQGNLAASRAPYKICHDCLMSALENAGELAPGTHFIQVNF